MNSLTGPRYENVDPNLVMAKERAEHYMLDGFKPTDMQFNIGRIEGNALRGFDLVNPQTKDRVFVTGYSSVITEQLLRAGLGKHSVLESTERADDYTVFTVPRASRLLQKTLDQGPYNPLYMRSLAVRSYVMMKGLADLDSQAFGLTTDAIALTHNGEADGDDVHLTVIPPLPEMSGDKYNDLETVRKTRLQRSLGRVALGELNSIALNTSDHYINFDLKPLTKYFNETIE